MCAFTKRTSSCQRAQRSPEDQAFQVSDHLQKPHQNMQKGERLTPTGAALLLHTVHTNPRQELFQE